MLIKIGSIPNQEIKLANKHITCLIKELTTLNVPSLSQDMGLVSPIPKSCEKKVKRVS